MNDRARPKAETRQSVLGLVPRFPLDLVSQFTALLFPAHALSPSPMLPASTDPDCSSPCFASPAKMGLAGKGKKLLSRKQMRTEGHEEVWGSDKQGQGDSLG